MSDEKTPAGTPKPASPEEKPIQSPAPAERGAAAQAPGASPSPAPAGAAAQPPAATQAAPQTATAPPSPAPAQSPAAPQAPAAAAKPAAPPAPASQTTKPPEKPKPVVHVYSRQKDQHVVGPGCWCMPKVEVVDGRKIVVHKRD